MKIGRTNMTQILFYDKQRGSCALHMRYIAKPGELSDKFRKASLIAHDTNKSHLPPKQRHTI
jgi:hypothetical protein